MDNISIVELRLGSESLKNELIELYTKKLYEVEQQAEVYRDLLRQLSVNFDAKQNSNLVSVSTDEDSVPSLEKDDDKVDLNQPLKSFFFNEERIITDGFNLSWSFSRKVHYIISKADRCLTTRQIINRLVELEPALSQNPPLKAISALISNKVNQKKMFNRYKGKKADYFIGLREWFDNNDELIDDRKKGKE